MKPKPGPFFYIPVPDNDHDVAGPYDLVQMARLLRTKMITAETLTFKEGDQEWKPFCEHPQFIVAREMSPNADSMHQDVLAEKEATARSPIPLPSAEFVVKAVILGFLLMVGSAVAALIGWADSTAGFCIVILGGTAGLLGQAMILIHLLDESFLTKVMIIFIPLFDIYYFLANIEKYLFYFLAKYIGVIVAAAAFAGIAIGDPLEAEKIKVLLGIIRL